MFIPLAAIRKFLRFEYTLKVASNKVTQLESDYW